MYGHSDELDLGLFALIRMSSWDEEVALHHYFRDHQPRRWNLPWEAMKHLSCWVCSLLKRAERTWPPKLLIELVDPKVGDPFSSSQNWAGSMPGKDISLTISMKVVPKCCWSLRKKSKLLIPKVRGKLQLLVPLPFWAIVSYPRMERQLRHQGLHLTHKRAMWLSCCLCPDSQML